MKTFKQFSEEVPVNNMGSGAIAKYDPIMTFKIFRRKKKKKK